jgi:hypothetical protein
MKTSVQAATTAVFEPALFSPLFVPASGMVFHRHVHRLDRCPQSLTGSAQPEVLQRRLNAGPNAETRGPLHRDVLAELDGYTEYTEKVR